jgi:hypothetical protein
MAPNPEFMEISSHMGPLTTTILANEVVELKSELSPVDAIAKMTGKYSGLAPAITAFTATFSTVYSHASWGGDGRMEPTPSSGLWLVALSISATLPSVGSTIGK